ncbi:MAG: ankyrin repeat domain-containing protein [Chitinophagaceae bacterium]
MDNKELGYFIDACRRGDVKEVQQMCGLFQHLINEKDLKGFTPLIIAVYNKHPEVVSVLLQNGANVDAQDEAGNTALMGACFKGYPDLASMLLEAGAAINLRNFQGAPALTFAATFGQLGIAEMLLKKGAHSNLVDSRGKTSLDHASMQENSAMIDLLHQYSTNNAAPHSK